MINREEAIKIARNRATEKNWAFVEPLQVEEWYKFAWKWNLRGSLSNYKIRTNAAGRGTYACFDIDALTGQITFEEYRFLSR